MADERNSEEKLFEICREAHKLTQMISSWPKGPNSDGRSKNVMTSLLQGAFDLQESLITLRDLQEAPNVMCKLNREVEVGDVSFRLMASRRFERLAMDGSLLGYIDELKKVIKESSGDEKASSSRSLKSSDLATGAKKAKAPNLVAKLMGLQELPSDTSHPPRKETKHDDQCLVQPRSILAIEMPTARKPRSIEKNPELRTSTVKDIVEFVKSNESSEGGGEIKGHTRLSCPGNQFDNKAPTNVHRCTDPRVSRRTRAARSTPEETVCDNGEMLPAKFDWKEMRNMKMSKLASSQKTVDLDSVSKQKQRKAVTPLTSGQRSGYSKQPKAAAGAKSQPKLVSRSSPPKSYRRSSIRNDISSNDRLVVPKGANAPRKQNLSSTVKKIAEAKPIRRCIDANAATGNANCKDIRDRNQCYNLCTVDAPPKQVQSNSIAFLHKEYKRRDSRIFCEVIVKSNKCNRSSRSPTVGRAAAKLEEEVGMMKLLLLRSQSFISHAREHFGLDDLHGPASHHRKCTTTPGAGNAELLLGCAEELLVRKRRQLELLNHQMLRASRCSMSPVVSLDQLADEIGYGIEKLDDYSKNDVGVGLKESIYSRLGRDLGCKDMVISAMWDVGWLNWVCVAEADRVVGRVVELVLYGLVEELVVEFVYE